MSNQGNPTPIAWAAPGLARGSVSNSEQEFGGLKKFPQGIMSPFVKAIIPSSSLSLIGTNGTGSSDVAIKAGTLVADAIVHSSAKIFGLYTGLSGSEVEKFSISKAGDIRNASGYFRGAAANGYLRLDDSAGAVFLYGSNSLSVVGGGLLLSAGGGGVSVVAVTSNSIRANQFNNLFSLLGDNGSHVTNRIGSGLADASVVSTAKLASIGTGIEATYVEYACFQKTGLTVSGAITFNRSLVDLGLSGFPTQIIGTNQGFLVDTTLAVGGTAKLFTYRTFGDNKSWVTGRGTYGSFSSLATAVTGSTTLNNAKGRVNIPSGTSSTYTITNDQVTSDSVVTLEWENLPIAGSDSLSANWTVTVANGSFTIIFYDTNGGTTDLQQPATFRFTVHQ